MAEPPADLLAIQSDIHTLLTRLNARATRAPTYATDKGPLLRAARHVSYALSAIDDLIALYRSED